MEIMFSHAYNLIFLIAIPLIFFIHFLSLKYARKNALKFANFEAIERVTGKEVFSKNITLLYVNMLIALFIVFAISGMTLGVIRETSVFSFVIAVDASSSMTATDLVPNRIEAAKYAAQEFVNNAPGSTRIGVISFSGSSYIEQKITDSKADVNSAIKKIEIKQIGGTDILDATITASNMLENEDSKSIILLSDGQINVNTINDVIDYANKNDIMIHTIGIGTKEGNRTDINVISKLDENSLKAIALNTKGKYFSAENRDFLLNSFNDVISVTKKRVSIDMTYYLLIAALILFVINWILANTRYRTIP